MYLHQISAKNFRAFGNGISSPSLEWLLNPGVNILIGENDAGKTSIIDAIRLLLWTTSFETVRLSEQDFHIVGDVRAESLVIEATLRNLSPEQESTVLEWLTYESDGSCSLVINLQAKKLQPLPKRRSRIDVVTRSGRNGSGPEIGHAVREMIRTTYLRPLRDAEAELSPGRQSRLSQILGAHELVANQGNSDFNKETPLLVPKTLVGLMEHAQHHMSENPAIVAVETNINKNYLGSMAFVGDVLASQIRITGNTSLSQILERFELGLLPPVSIASHERCSRGLGYNNALFMATELVLLRNEEELSLLLVEEPEAHLHPQLQERVIKLLQQPPLENEGAVQVIMTTHSPSLAAGAAIETITLVHKGRTYPLRPEETRLAQADYEFLRRFIDATKSNLFFARGVVMVEGPSEALLLPAIAEMVGLSFSKYGISIVNVGNVGLYHYARIFQRQKDNEVIFVPIACMTDRDIVPDIATYVSKTAGRKRFESDYSAAEATAVVQRKIDRVESSNDPNVKVFVSDHWTLEFDLAITGLSKLMFDAIAIAKIDKTKGEHLSKDDVDAALIQAKTDWNVLEASGISKSTLATEIYHPIYKKNASKAVTAQYAAKLLLTGEYGSGNDLLNSLPPYLKSLLRHVTGTSDPLPAEVVMPE